MEINNENKIKKLIYDSDDNYREIIEEKLLMIIMLTIIIIEQPFNR